MWLDRTSWDIKFCLSLSFNLLGVTLETFLIYVKFHDILNGVQFFLRYCINCQYPLGAFFMLMYQNVYINQTHNLRKFGGNTTIQTWIVANNNVWKCPKIAIKSRVSIPWLTCSYIWHINTSIKCAFWLDKYSMKVWWQYVLPNTKAVHFCAIFFRH